MDAYFYYLQPTNQSYMSQVHGETLVEYYVNWNDGRTWMVWTDDNGEEAGRIRSRAF